MKKQLVVKNSLMVLVLLMAMVLTACGGNSEPTAAPLPTLAEPALVPNVPAQSPNVVMGKVTAVSNTEVTIDGRTTIDISSQSANIGQVAVGDTVQISVQSDSNGRLTATSLIALPGLDDTATPVGYPAPSTATATPLATAVPTLIPTSTATPTPAVGGNDNGNDDNGNDGNSNDDNSNDDNGNDGNSNDSNSNDDHDDDSTATPTPIPAPTDVPGNTPTPIPAPTDDNGGDDTPTPVPAPTDDHGGDDNSNDGNSNDDHSGNDNGNSNDN